MEFKMPVKDPESLRIPSLITTKPKKRDITNIFVQFYNNMHMRKFIFLFLIVNCLCISLKLLYSKHFFTIRLISYQEEDCQPPSESKDYVINTPGCRIPKFHPFDPSIADNFWELSNPTHDCYDDRFLYYKGNKIYLHSENVKKRFKSKDLNCIYQAIIRDPYNSSTYADYEIAFGKIKTLVFDKPIEDEFLKVTCFLGKIKVFTDYLAIPIVKPEVEKRCKNASKNFLSENPLNIIIIGVDSVSKLNFLRHFPLTNGLLETTLEAFDFRGHTKVADDALGNFIPMMTGHFLSYYRNGSEIFNNYYDNLHFIWKEFSALGYQTLFMEDTPDFGTFTYPKQGFKKPPSDYFLRPFFLTTKRTQEKWRTLNGYSCFGFNMTEIEFFYDYFYKFVTLMDKRPFFAFSFISNQSRHFLNNAGSLDKSLFDILQKLISSNVLKNSLLIFFSNHGLRFGPILQTYIGKIEERMPFMFQKYPDWFLKKYPDIQKALTINQHRLTTPFDVHKTLEDIVVLSSKNGQNLLKQADSGFGQSLFKEISPYRTCSNASISSHWCVCNNMVSLKQDDPMSLKIANKLIDIINKLTNSSSTCVKQSVKSIINAFISIPEDLETLNRSSENSPTIFDYFVTFEAEPSNAQFEGTLRYDGTEYKLIGNITNINNYDNQSICTKNYE